MVTAKLEPAQRLRQCVNASGGDRFEQSRGAFRLTVMTLSDMPGALAFVIHEARPHGWWPLISGRVTSEDELILTCGELPAAYTLSQMLEFLLNDQPWTGQQEPMESLSAAY